MTVAALRSKVFSLRKDILRLVYEGKTGHIGGDFSVCDILAVLYCIHMNVSPASTQDPNRDRFILSKGHSVEALYCVLAEQGFFEKDVLYSTFSRFDSPFIGHPNNKINGIEMNSGSLGHGLSVGVGMALAARMDNKIFRTYVVMGDGELAEGSVWEGFMSAGHYKLDNLVAVIDRNRLQISGNTEMVMHHDDLAARIASFGWHVIETAGNNVDALLEAFNQANETKGTPCAIIANTTKGYGVSFMENKADWHHHVPTPEEYAAALQELTQKEEATRDA